MSGDYQIERCRALYGMLRHANNFPVIITIKSPWGWYAETKQGEKIFEQHQGHCAWCVKANALLKWSETHERNSDKGH